MYVVPVCCRGAGLIRDYPSSPSFSSFRSLLLVLWNCLFCPCFCTLPAPASAPWVFCGPFLLTFHNVIAVTWIIPTDLQYGMALPVVLKPYRVALSPTSLAGCSALAELPRALGKKKLEKIYIPWSLARAPLSCSSLDDLIDSPITQAPLYPVHHTSTNAPVVIAIP